MKKLLFSLAAVACFMCTSCDKNSKTKVVAPSTYTFEREGVSTVSYGGQTTRIAMATELIGALKDTDKSATNLKNMFANQNSPFADANLNASSKSVRSKVAASTDFFASNQTESTQIKNAFDGWIDSQVVEVFPNWTTNATEGTAGQIADGTSTRYVSAKGVEYNQVVNKGLIGALMLDQIANNYLSTSVLDASDNKAKNDNGTVAEGKSYTTMEHKWDEAYGYLFGASVNGANPVSTIGSDDKFLNKYLGKVNGDSDFDGIAQNVFDAFKLGRAAIVAKDYDLRDKQADIIKEQLSKVVAVRAVHYLQAGKSALNADNYGSAFHDLSEGLGFVYSLRFTRKAGSSESYFLKSEVDGYVNDLTNGNGFWTITPEKLDEISNSIASKFDFTVEQAAN